MSTSAASPNLEIQKTSISFYIPYQGEKTFSIIPITKNNRQAMANAVLDRFLNCNLDPYAHDLLKAINNIDQCAQFIFAFYVEYETKIHLVCSLSNIGGGSKLKFSAVILNQELTTSITIPKTLSWLFEQSLPSLLEEKISPEMRIKDSSISFLTLHPELSHYLADKKIPCSLEFLPNSSYIKSMTFEVKNCFPLENQPIPRQLRSHVQENREETVPKRRRH